MQYEPRVSPPPDDTVLSLRSLRECIPAECMRKRPLVGLAYIVLDVLVICGSYLALVTSPQTWLHTLLYWNVSGFFMWCLFVDGHDCGHGSFSDSWTLNTVMGHLCHTPLLVPFSTWASSHRLHHLHHNHVKRDFSHVWVPVHCKDRKTWLIRALQASGLTPLLGWPLYLAGAVDGGHWVPLGGRLWRQCSRIDFLHSCVSSMLVLGFFAWLWRWCDRDVATLMQYYGGSWLVFSFWLVTVTYLQHHDDAVQDTVVYGDASWTFVKGALQTVDRSYGRVIDHLSHHITDGHLVHHLFFTKIPHYHLAQATVHLYAHLEKHGIPYKRRKTHDFVWRIFRLTRRHLNEATLVK
jgi:omega-3 fatty acid desaturase (delta-15 desaturase)